MKVTIEKAWQKFDEDGNGYIEEHELEDILDQIDDTFLNENNLDDVLEELDSDNHDGKIDKHGE
jgi:Ca2+-binding EF-hand superfamily protein